MTTAFAYSPRINAGRFSAGHYTLARLLAMRESLANGINPAFQVTILDGQTGTIDAAIDIIMGAINDKANRTPTGTVKAIPIGSGQNPVKVPADDAINRLEALRGQTGPIVVDGNTRALASLLDIALGGAGFKLPTVNFDGDEEAARLASFKGNADSALAVGLDWKTRTREVGALIKAEPTTTTEAVIMKRFNLGRGVAQHATASAVAVGKHGLDLDKCQSLTAAQWRDVRDAKSQADAEALAYGTSVREKAWSPRTVCATLVKNGYSGQYAPLVQAIADGDLERFRTLVGE